MDSGLFAFFLPVTLALMMMGLGLELSVKDFMRVGRYPKVVFLALFTQLIILVSIAFLICKVLNLPPLLAVGLMLLAGIAINALAGAGLAPTPPLLRLGLFTIAAVLILRALAFPLLRSVFPGNSELFWFVSSGLVGILGVLFLVGTLLAHSA